MPVPPAGAADMEVRAAIPAAPAPLRPPTGISIASTVPWEIDVPESEVVSVAPGGPEDLVWVTSPEASCGGAGLESLVVVLSHAPGGDLQERSVVPLGTGEVTSVAAHPGGSYAVTAQKDGIGPDSRPGRVVLVSPEGILDSHAVGIGPDSVAVSPTGELAVIACEAQQPDPDDCAAEAGAADSEGSIDIVDLRAGPGAARVVARVTGATIHARGFRSALDRAARAEDVEPEYVAISPNGRMALVTLQEQSAVCVLDLGPVLAAHTADPAEARVPASVEALGERCLAGVVTLPHGTRDQKGLTHGVHPDGVAFSPDGKLALTANEAHSKAPELQGVSVLDLRDGPTGVRLVATHSIYDLDPGLAEARSAHRASKKVGGHRRPDVETIARTKKLPRLDPEGVALAAVGGRVVAAVAIERSAPREEGGSVLLLDVTRALEGAAPVRIGRTVVGASEDARPETLAFGRGGRHLFVASERDGGTITVVEIEG